MAGSSLSWRSAQAMYLAVGLTAVSALGWWALPTARGVHVSLCGFDLSRIDLSAGVWDLAGLRLALLLKQPLQALASWSIMALAMAPPLVASALCPLATAAPRALTGILAFLVGYAVVWALAAPVFLALALGLELLAAALGAAPFGLALVLALTWQVSAWRRPVLQLCDLRRGASSRRLGLGTGLKAGFGCLGACWALMGAAMAVPVVGGADPRWPMALATLVLTLERLALLRAQPGAHASNRELVTP